MPEITRRGWLTMLGLGPLTGAAVAWGQHIREQKSKVHARHQLSPREHFRNQHLPNLVLTTHQGERVRFYDDLVKDKSVVINFMYADCERICSPVSANLARVQRMLGDRVGRDIFFYSITLKPEADTVSDLKKYADMHHAGAGWTFLTGDPEDIEFLRRSLGFTYVDPVEDADKDNHIGMVRVGNESHLRWAACPGQSDAEWIKTFILLEVDGPARVANQASA